MKLAPYAKAIVGGLVTALSAAVVALTDGIINPVEIITIALAFIAGTGVVYATPNIPSVDSE
jgi:hypothetical protein